MCRTDREKKAVELMIRLYCRKNGHQTPAPNALCSECGELLAYAHKRLSCCKFGPAKPTCQKCPIHCYKPEMRDRIRAVMRFSGPRMILHHPLIAIRHLFE